MKRSRRAFLRAAALVGTAGAAGCNRPGGTPTKANPNGGNGGGASTATATSTGTATGTTTATETDTPTQTPTQTPIPVGSSERWETFQFDTANSGAVDLNHRQFSDGQENWNMSFPGNKPAQPAFDEERLYVPTGDAVTAIDRETQEVLWTFDVGENGASTPLVDDQGFVYFVTGSGVYRLHAEDGWSALDYKFTTEFPSIIATAAKSAPVKVGNQIVFNLVMRKSSGVSPVTRVVSITERGDLNWMHEPRGPNNVRRAATIPPTVFAPTPVVNGNTLYVTSGHGKQDAAIYGINISNGGQRWFSDYKGKGWASITVKNNRLFFADRYLQVYDHKGNRIARRTVDPPPNAYAVAAGEEYVFMSSRTYGGNEGRMFAVNENGQVEWTFEGEGNLYVPAATNDTVYVGSASGALFAIAQSDGLVRWKQDLGLSGLVRASGPAISSEEIFIGASSEDNPMNLYSVSPV